MKNIKVKTNFFQQKQVFDNYEVLNVGITVIYNNVCTAHVKHIIT